MDPTPPNQQQSLGLPDRPGIGDGWELVEVDQPSSAPTITGERLERIRAIRAAIVEDLALGKGVKRIAAQWQISPQVVRAIKAEAWRRGEVDPLKERLGRDLLALGDALRERVMDDIDKVPLQVAVLASAQAIDKGLLLTGAPTARVEVNHTLTVESVADYIESLPVCGPVMTQESEGQKAAGSADRLDVAGASGVGASLPAAELEVSDGERTVDSQSIDSAQVSEVESTDSAGNGQIEGQKGGAE